MKILIVDDEELARQSLARKLATLDTAAQIDGVGDPHAALEQLLTDPPDVLFLDIEMPGLTGFELLAQIPADKRTFKLVFCTAYSEHALAAFEEAAVDYLLKPVEPERLQAALARSGPQPKTLPTIAKLLVRTRKGRRVVPIEDVVFFGSESHETVAYLVDGSEVVVDLSLSDLEVQTESSHYFRVHRSFLIALRHVETVGEGDTPQVELAGGHKIPLARRRKSDFLTALAAHNSD